MTTTTRRPQTINANLASAEAEGILYEKKWCSGGDLNPHALRHAPLKRTCLPFHHPSVWAHMIPQWRRGASFSRGGAQRCFACWHAPYLPLIKRHASSRQRGQVHRTLGSRGIVRSIPRGARACDGDHGDGQRELQLPPVDGIARAARSLAGNGTALLRRAGKFVVEKHCPETWCPLVSRPLCRNR